MIKKISPLILIFFLSLPSTAHGLDPYDVSIVGFSRRGASIAEHGLSFVRCLHEKAKIQFIAYKESDALDLPAELQSIVSQKSDASIKPSFENTAPIILLTDHHIGKCWSDFIALPENKIKFLYTVTSRTQCRPALVNKINTHFDALLVPDAFAAQSFKDSGLTIPVFVLPLSIHLDNFLQHKPHPKPSPFIFGCSGLFGDGDRKNHGKLMEAFAAEFKNEPHVRLVIHGRKGKEAGIWALENTIKTLNAPNITLLHTMLSKSDYEKLLTSFNCYVLISKGEGFSLSPREAMAAGIPCILSNNTAHKTICDSKFVYSIQSDIPLTEEGNVGLNFDCSINDVRKALRDVYCRYDHYLKIAQQGRKWAQQYSPAELAPKYLNLIKPKRIIYGQNNVLTDELLMTNSRKLYNKYKLISNT